MNFVCKYIIGMKFIIFKYRGFFTLHSENLYTKLKNLCDQFLQFDYLREWQLVNSIAKPCCQFSIGAKPMQFFLSATCCSFFHIIDNCGATSTPFHFVKEQTECMKVLTWTRNICLESYTPANCFSKFCQTH